ncbi:DNA-3-methyladenine glycosylase [Acidicapsa ligni]|uniref:DNA-3-methyladenine glycosylase n=1 Tax=Acidicapsa ligni TaxID=542300 RepID=UPI0021E0DFEC|nr:DNA-3-methyladenine glycosylase [Acidicapsa ligni]
MKPPAILPKNWRPVSRRFLTAAPELVAPQLLGKILAHNTSAGWIAGRIVEVEAYLGPHITTTPDPAAHSFRGVTPRNRVMFGPPGHAYVYFIYGMYFCMNVTCEPEGKAGCILIRALEPVLNREAMAINRNLPATALEARLTGGPGILCKALAITRPEDNGLDLLDADSPLQLRQDSYTPGPVEITPRIGIRHAADLPLRFTLANHPCVSRVPKSKFLIKPAHS